MKWFEIAATGLWKKGLFTLFDAVCYGPIHDEVVASVLIEDLPKFIPMMHECMVGNYADMGVPIRSSISLGKDFYNQIECGEEPTLEAIQVGLAQMRQVALAA